MEELSKKELYDQKKQEKFDQKANYQKGKKNKRIVLWVGVVIVLLIAIFGLYQLITSSTPAGPEILTDTISETDQVKWNKDAKVTIIEYSDFQCPACQAYYFMTKQLGEEFSDKVAFVYRHFPLSQSHANADIAAQAAEAAGKQGKFWEMHDLLFTNQSKWEDHLKPKSLLIEYATSLGLDTAQFEIDLESKEVKDKVKDDFRSGQKAGITGTPTFFINGLPIQNPRSYEEFRNIIDLAVTNS